MAKTTLGPNYRRVWMASTVSNLGDGVALTALPLLAARLSRDPMLVAGVSVAAGLPWLFLALVGGALADRADRRSIMVWADTFRTALVGILAAAVLADQASLPLLYGIAILGGAAEVFFDTASQAIMPSIVERDRLEHANGRLYAGQTVTNSFVGPPLGAAMFAAAAWTPFMLDAVSFAFSALLIVRVRGSFAPTPTVPDQVRATMRSDIADALRWLFRHRLLRTLAILLGTWNLVSTATMAIFVLYALELMGIGEVGFGLLMTTTALGGIAGSFAGSWFRSRLGEAASLRLAIGVSGAVCSVIPALTTHVIPVGLSFFVATFGGTVWNVITVSLRQRVIPDRMLGRVNSVYRLLGWGTIPIGAAVGGAIADVFGLRAPFWFAAAAGVVMLVASLPVLTRREIAAAVAAAE